MAAQAPPDSSRTTPKAKEPRRDCRVWDALRHMQVTGSFSRPFRSRGSNEADVRWRKSGARAPQVTAFELPDPFVRQLNDEERARMVRSFATGSILQKKSLVSMIRELYEYVHYLKTDKAELRKLIHQVYQRFLDPSGQLANLSENESAAIFNGEKADFLQLGGADCLVDVISMLRAEELYQWLGASEIHLDAISKITEEDLIRAAESQNARHRRRLPRVGISNYWAKRSNRNRMNSPALQPMSLFDQRPPRIEDNNQRVTTVRDIVAKNRPTDPSNKFILNDTMGILRELCFFSPSLARQLCNKDELIIYLFQLMEEPRLFDNAAGLVEEILAVREDSFDLTSIPLVIFEPEDRRLLENSKIIKSLELLRLRRNRMMRIDNVVDRNHAVIFNTPKILDRLLSVLRVQNSYFALNPIYEPMAPEFATSTEFAILLTQTGDREDWDSINRLMDHPHMRLVEEESEFRLGGAAGTSDDESPPTVSSPSTTTGNPRHRTSPWSLENSILRTLILRNRSLQQRSREDIEAEVIMKAILLAPYRVEVLFVLCTLLNGKRKSDFQDRLARLGLVRTLNFMFDKFQWINNNTQPQAAPLHGPGCGCSLDASLKIQFLRLIHNFCDRDYSNNTSKLQLFLSCHELELLRQGDLQPISLDHDDKGLLAKIILTLVHQPDDSIYRFWLSSCVEAFLRRAAPEEQLFVARTPLLQSLVQEILNGGSFRAQGSFQSAFDLLGEMTKGNLQSLQLFHRALSNVQFTKFMEVVVRNLVDSNVFVRSMLLSGEKFHTQSLQAQANDALVNHMTGLERMDEFLAVNMVRLLRDLMTIVTMEDVNHENICCLNTAVLIFVFEHRRNRLPALLQALRAQDENSSTQPGFVCENFRSLLWFWIQYYTPRGRDRLSLEHSSDMKFDEWREVVSLLCADDGSATSLLEAPKNLPPSPYTRLFHLVPSSSSSSSSSGSASCRVD